MKSVLKNVSQRISNKEGVKKYFFNTSWLIATQGVRLFAGFFVGLWLARYLGPKQFGIYNYVTSFDTIFRSIATVGVTDTLVKKIIESPKDEKDNLASAFMIRFIGGIFSFILLFIILFIFPQEAAIQKYIIIISPMLFVQALDVIDFFYVAKVRVKDSAKYRIIQIIFSSVVKIFLIINEVDLMYFILMGLLDMIFYGIVILLNYRKYYPNFIFIKTKWELTSPLFKASIPLMVIALSTLLFQKGDQIILANLTDQFTAGVYSSAVRTIEMVTMFFGLTIQSLFPAIINAKFSDQKLFIKRFVLLSRVLIISSILIACFVSFFSKEIILLLFGEKFLSAQIVLAILSFNIIFATMSLISYRWYIVENLQHFMMIKVILLAIFNISLNFYLVPRLGIKGAAISSLVSHFIFFFLFELLMKKTRQCFKINCLIA